MKRILRIVIAVMMLICLVGCGAKHDADDGKIDIVATVFPQYDWTKNIIGDSADNINLTLLVKNGSDLHSYNPSAEDIMLISTCDIFIYVGGESDIWVEEALAQATNEDMKVINLMEVLGDSLKQEVHVENGEEHEHDHDTEKVENDEHIWLSLKNASLLCDAIGEALMQADPDNKAKYEANLEEYKKRLNELDVAYQAAVNEAEGSTIVVADRFPFLYLMEDYGIDYYAAFSGCSAETEASFDTIVFLAGKIDEYKLSNICTLEKSDNKLAETIIDNTQDKTSQIVVLDSMQSVTENDVNEGTTYISIMQANLEALKKALKKY